MEKREREERERKGEKKRRERFRRINNSMCFYEATRKPNVKLSNA